MHCRFNDASIGSIGVTRLLVSRLDPVIHLENGLDCVEICEAAYINSYITRPIFPFVSVVLLSQVGMSKSSTFMVGFHALFRGFQL